MDVCLDIFFRFFFRRCSNALTIYLRLEACAKHYGHKKCNEKPQQQQRKQNLYVQFYKYNNNNNFLFKPK